MADQLLMYISAADDLAFEREVLGRAVTEIPTTLSWRIVQTPLEHEEPNLNLVTRADVHLLLLGSDVRAPVGVEWMAARRSGHAPVLLLKGDATQTQAARAFRRELERVAEWQRFEGPEPLRTRVLDLLADHILKHSEHYSLSDEEYEMLKNWRKDLKKSKKRPEAPTRGGAGASSVILSTKRYVPSEGVLLTEPARPSRRKQ